MAYLFFSYSRKNSQETDAHVEALLGEGFTIWRDVREGNEGIPPGADFEQEIKSAIESNDCKGLILQWSAEASESKWVRREIDLALKANVPIYPLPLDKTALPSLIPNNNEKDIDTLINYLYEEEPEARRRVNEQFDFEVSLGVQQGEEKLGNTELVKVPLVTSSHTEAYVVGTVDYTVGKKPEHVLLCAQFTGKQGTLFLTQALEYFQSVYENTSFVAIHVTPKRIRRQEYVLEKQSEWLDAVMTCITAVDFFRQTHAAEVHIFGKMPVALGLMLTPRFSTNTVIHLYNDEQSGSTFTYTPVDRIVR